MTFANSLIDFFPLMLLSFNFLLKDWENQMPNEPTCLQGNAAFQKYKSLQM